MKEFFTSDSGIVLEKNGISFGCALVAVLTVGVIFGTFEPAVAHSGCPSSVGCGNYHGHGGCCGGMDSLKYRMWKCCRVIVGGVPVEYIADEKCVGYTCGAT